MKVSAAELKMRSHPRFTECLSLAFYLLGGWAWNTPVLAASPLSQSVAVTATLASPVAPAVVVPAVLEDAALFLPETPQQVSRLILRLSERRLYTYADDRLVAVYPVAIGRDGWQTPTGEFTIFQRQPYPVWEHPLTGELVPPGPDNPLGTRWLGFWTDGVNAIGFHGTPDEDLIGQAVSHGCVRMRNADIAELFDRVEVGTPVIVLP